jgi:glycine C-acetyltransferase
MSADLYGRIASELETARAKGTYKESLFLESPMAPRVRMEGHGEVLVLSSNNYLGLANHPEVMKAGIEGIKNYGAGTGSVRFICGSFVIHRKLEKELADFLKKEAALSYVSCWNANTGLIPAIATEKDVLISDEWNHASIIDACRMAGAKVTRKVYNHSNMDELKKILEESRDFENRFVITDGVFSMEGDIAKLPEIVELARKHKAIIIMDDSHSTGVLGKSGAGTADHFGLEREVDIITSTLGKALGGAAGGFVAGRKEVIDYLFQKSRPMLFSNALPPTVAASALKAVQVLRSDPTLIKKLKENSEYFRKKLQEIGYKPLPGEAAIIPIILGETSRAIAVSKKLLEKKIFVTGFGYPVVPEGTARIRIQMSAALTRDDLDYALKVFKELKTEIGL